MRKRSTIAFAYASVVSIKDIQLGEKLTKKNIWVKRPGTGDFLAVDYDSLLGSRAKCAIVSGDQVKRGEVDGFD